MIKAWVCVQMFNVCVRLAQLMNYEALDSPNLTVHTNACVCPAQLMNYKYQDPPPPPPPLPLLGSNWPQLLKLEKDSWPEWWKKHVFVAWKASWTYTAVNCWIFNEWGRRKAWFRKWQKSAAWSVGTSSTFLLLRHGLYFRWSIWPHSKTKWLTMWTGWGQHDLMKNGL